MDMNQFILDGNLTRAPEVRYTAAGMPICTFTLATHAVSGSGDERREHTSFIPITTIGRLAETSARNLRKGAGVTVIGCLASWANAETYKSGFNFEAHQVIYRHRAPRAAMGASAATGQGLPAEAPQPAEASGIDQTWVAEFDAADQAMARPH